MLRSDHWSRSEDELFYQIESLGVVLCKWQNRAETASREVFALIAWRDDEETTRSVMKITDML
jgi:hypothetical protein